MFFATRTSLLVISLVIFSFSVTFADSSKDSLVNNLSWQCGNNASCVNAFALTALKRLERKEPLDFGIFSILPRKSNFPDQRSYQSLNIFGGNKVQIPIGPSVVCIQQSEKFKDYFEVLLLKSVPEEERGKNYGRRKDMKQLKVIIPMYLAANAFGWTILAIKAVGVFTLKALLVSQLAFIIASGILLKRFLEKTNEKMTLTPNFQHQPSHPYILPYNMEYALSSQPLSPVDLTQENMYSIPIGNSAEIVAPSFEHVNSDSSLGHIAGHENLTLPNNLAIY